MSLSCCCNSVLQKRRLTRSKKKSNKWKTGLINPVYLEGDSTWTIEERMKHYHVPGVSIAVIKDGKIEWTKSYGVMDEETKEPVTNERFSRPAP